MTARAPGGAGRRRDRAARHGSVAAAAAGLVTALVVGAGTHALWSGRDTASGGVLTAGDLDAELGQGTWEQVTPGVPAPASGQITGDVLDFVAMPGDVVRLVQPVTTRLRGDNLRAGFSVRHLGSVDSSRYTSSFHVEDADGRQVAPATGDAPAGTLVEVPAIAGDDAGVAHQWQVVVRVEVVGDQFWNPEGRPAVSGAFSPGALILRLEQVRQGTGFVATGGAP